MNGEKLCQCPDENEEIEINFDELEKQMKAAEETDKDLTSTLEPEPTDLSLKEVEHQEEEVEEEELDENILAALLEEEVEEKVEEKLSEYNNMTDDELGVNLKEAFEENRKKKVNPFAVCHTSVRTRKIREI